MTKSDPPLYPPGSIAASNDSVYVKWTINLPCEYDDLNWCLNHTTDSINETNDHFTTSNAITGSSCHFTTSNAITGTSCHFTISDPITGTNDLYTTTKIATNQTMGNFVTSSNMIIGEFTSPASSGHKLSMSAEEVVTVRYSQNTTELVGASVTGIEELAHTSWDFTDTSYAKVEKIGISRPAFVASASTTPKLRTFVTTIYAHGFCFPSNAFLSCGALMTFQKVYASFYLISFIVRIYIFVVRRRRLRRRQKIRVVVQPKVELTAVPKPALVFNVIPRDSCHDGLVILNDNPQKQNGSNQNDENDIYKEKKMESVLVDSGSRSKYEMERMKNNDNDRAESLLSANVRTAAMLFVVTLVFILCFLPAWLMAVDAIETQLLVFHAYYFYNVANPLIYAFMNPMFRKEMKKLFRDKVLAQRWS